MEAYCEVSKDPPWVLMLREREKSKYSVWIKQGTKFIVVFKLNSGTTILVSCYVTQIYKFASHH